MISRHICRYSSGCREKAVLLSAKCSSISASNKLTSSSSTTFESQLNYPSRSFASWNWMGTNNFNPVANVSFKQKRYRSGGENKLGETSIMRQEGTEIQEVPLAVLKQPKDTESEGLPAAKSYIDLDPREEAAFVEGFSNYKSPQQILKILDTIPSQEVTPSVGLSILKKLFELENNFGFRNGGLPWTISSENSATDTFARCAIVTRLVETIVTTDDVNILIGAVKALGCERSSSNIMESNQSNNQFNSAGNGNPPSILFNGEYRKRIFDEVLLRITEGKFSLLQVCETVITLGKMQAEGKYLPNDLVDKLWIGITENSSDIDVKNITEVFRTLPYFSQSRPVIINLAEKKLLSLWWKMDTEKVAKICSVIMADRNYLLNKNISGVDRSPLKHSVRLSNRALSALSRCTSLNIHQISETDLRTIIQSFNAANFCDDSIEKALNKYMKAKCLKISEPSLVAAVMDYVKKFHIQSPNIMEAAAEYLVLHKGINLSPPQFTSVISAFGLLDFQPPNGRQFWKIVEGYLNEKFIQFSPKDVISVFLSCVYLTKYPLNFIDRIFSPYFLDRLHSNDMEYSFLQNLRSQLKLLDSAFTIECPNKYGGPMLPKDFTARSVFIDGRILRMASTLEDIMKEIVGLKITFERSLVLPSLPLNAAYIADILISNVKTSDSDRYNYVKNRVSSRINTGISPPDNLRDLTIILIHLPEHFTKNGKNLIGSEVMRIRHLKLIGFNVATVNYETLVELKMHPVALRDYIRERLTNAGFTSW